MKVIIKTNTGETVTLSRRDTVFIEREIKMMRDIVCESSVLCLLKEDTFKVQENNFVYLPSSICAIDVQESIK